MSLEQRIIELTDAINVLTDAILSGKVRPHGGAPIQKIEPPEQLRPHLEPQSAPTSSPKIDREELKSHCLTMVRKNPELKDSVKRILQTFGVTRIDQVPDSALADLKSHIEGLGQ